MTSQEQLSLVQKAVYNDDLVKLFLGDPEYRWRNLKHIPANVATDIGAIIEQGIYKIYTSGDIGIVSNFEKAIYDLLSCDSAHAVWTAYFALRYQYRNEIKNESPFKIVDSKLCKAVSSCVKANKELLSTCKEYVGYDLANGLWDDIQRLENVMRSNYGVSIL